MKKYKAILSAAAALALAGCGSVETIKTTEYDASGNIAKVTETSRDVSDFSAYIAGGEDNATVLAGDITRFNFGYSGWGINWLSVSGSRVKAPVNKKSNAAEALEKTAGVVSATKTSVRTGDISINAAAPSEKSE